MPCHVTSPDRHLDCLFQNLIWHSNPRYIYWDLTEIEPPLVTNRIALFLVGHEARCNDLKKKMINNIGCNISLSIQPLLLTITYQILLMLLSSIHSFIAPRTNHRAFQVFYDFVDDLCLFNSLRPSDAIWRQWSWTTLAQVMACSLTAPSHYLNQCWLIIRGVLWHSSENSFAGIDQGIDSGYEFEKDILKNIFKSPRGQWVNMAITLSCSPQTEILNTLRTSVQFINLRKYIENVMLDLCSLNGTPNLVKSWSRAIGCYDDVIALKFDKQLGSAAAEVCVKFQSDWKRLNLNLAALRRDRPERRRSISWIESWGDEADVLVVGQL